MAEVGRAIALLAKAGLLLALVAMTGARVDAHEPQSECVTAGDIVALHGLIGELIVVAEAGARPNKARRNRMRQAQVTLGMMLHEVAQGRNCLTLNYFAVRHCHAAAQNGSTLNNLPEPCAERIP